MLDIDHFKKVNDTYGHDGGDVVLRHFADLLGEHFKQDLLARIGGEEFAVLLSNPESAAAQCESFRALVSQSKVKAGKELLSFTVSIGLVCGQYPDLEAMLKSADGALYQAKAEGRNRVVVAEPLVRAETST